MQCNNNWSQSELWSLDHSQYQVQNNGCDDLPPHYLRSVDGINQCDAINPIIYIHAEIDEKLNIKKEGDAK